MVSCCHVEHSFVEVRGGLIPFLRQTRHTQQESLDNPGRLEILEATETITTPSNDRGGT